MTLTETRADDTKSKDRDARKDAWDVLNKALNTLMIAHAAGLVTCLTLVKDYKAESPGQLKGLGLFIGLFGVGLVTAIICAVLLLTSRTQYLRGPGARESKYCALIRTCIGLANTSVVILILAILLAVYKFSTL
jgi:hypothetical protein